MGLARRNRGVDLHAHLLALFSPLAPGEEVVPGVVFEDTSVELGLRLRFRVGHDGGRLFVDVGQVTEVRRFAARSALFAFGYRTEGGRQKLSQSLGMDLCQALAERARRNEAAVRLRIEEEQLADPHRAARTREVSVSRALEPAGVGEAHHYALNPYVGCVVGCRFCYAQSPLAAQRALLGLSAYDWGSYVEVRTNLPEVLAAELETMPPLPIKVCPIVGDAYQGPEKRYELTRRCLEVIAEATEPWPTLVLTRTALMARDIDVLARIPSAWAGVSLPTVDDSVRAHFEPRAASVSARLSLLKELRQAGVSTLAVVQPMMAGDLDALVTALAEHADAVVVDLLQEEEGAVADFDAPQFAETRTAQWQQERAVALLQALRARGVAVWKQELPPDVLQKR